MARKTEFELDLGPDVQSAKARIVQPPKGKPYVNILFEFGGLSGGANIKDRDLERFAVNILKALGSKKLKQ